MKPVIGICRVARIEGNELDIQEECIRTYAGSKSYELAEVHRIVEPAANSSSRPLFWRLMESVKERASDLGGPLFCSPDRLSRNLQDFESVCTLAGSLGLSIEFTEVPAMSMKHARWTLLFGNAAGMSPSQDHSALVRRGQENRARLGLFVGKAPYGYENVCIANTRYAETIPGKARVVRRAFGLIAQGSCGIGGLGAVLLAEGLHRTPQCPRFSRRQLNAMLRNRAYLGEVHYGGKSFEGSHKPIIDTDIFDRVQDNLDLCEGRRPESRGENNSSQSASPESDGRTSQ